ncbi:MAG: integrase core domain-containing protein [Patescibacteria group bacterium]|jgi:transposase InsO family protein
MNKPLPAELFCYFKSKPIVLINRHERWKKVAKEQKISREAAKRLEWIIFYETKGEFNAVFTCRHFGIARKTFYKYLNRFNQNPISLEDHSKRPFNVRQKMITLEEETRIISLRKRYIFYGAEKLRAEYNELYGKDISSWKIGYTIAKFQLYPNPKKVDKHRLQIKRNRRKRKITELKKRNENILGHLIQIDTIVLHLDGLKRYILTAIDTYGKLAFARVYRNASSYSAADFLERLNFLFDDQIVNIQTDNGSEFLKHFEKACQSLKMEHFFSRARTPQDNAYVERFNQTLQKEWLSEGHFHPDPSVMNAKLTDWLIRYNFHRRHASLGNISPINYCIKNRQLLPMYSTRTGD